ncbi:MAG: alpha/beta hydrolase [Promethearchaeota archaeon]|nr:MAG: alpha/beta hydrolase [Candidatus Lokiarchaeota archaeon]
MDPKNFTANVNDVDLACSRWGEGNTKRIMLVHGWTGFKEMWNDFAPSLVEEGFDVVAMDLRGHGDSSKPKTEYTHEVFSKDLYELATHLGWDDGFILLGQSMGGYIVLDYALRYPETLTHVIPSNTSVYLARNFLSKIVWKLTIWMYKKNPEKMMRKMFPKFFMNPPPQEIIDGFVKMSLKTAHHAGLSAIHYCITRNLEPKLHQIKVPTLVISSEHDQKSLRDATLILHKLIPNSELVDIPDTGHLPFMENPEPFLKAIVDFVK